MHRKSDLSCTPVELPNGMKFRSITECALVLGCGRRFVSRCLDTGELDKLVARIPPPIKQTITPIDVERAVSEAFAAVFHDRFHHKEEES